MINLKVLIIAQYFPPDMGGGATRAYNVAKGLKLNGCEVTVVTAFPHYPSGNVPERYRWKPKHSSAQTIEIAIQSTLKEVLADAG